MSDKINREYTSNAMATEEIIRILRDIIFRYRKTDGSLMDELIMATDRLEELQEAFSETVKQRDKAMREAAHWKSIAEHRQSECNSLVARPELSRLEIAAMLLAALASRESGTWEAKQEAIWAIEQADELIALAKEVK